MIQYLDHDKSSSFSQLIKGKPRGLQKLLKYFNRATTSASNILLSFGVLPIIFVLHSKWCRPLCSKMFSRVRSRDKSKVSWWRHQVSNFSKLIIPIDRESKMKQKSSKNHILKINRHRLVQIWKMSKTRTDNLLTRQMNWNIFWSTSQKLLKIGMKAYGTMFFEITVWLSLKNFHNGGYE